MINFSCIQDLIDIANAQERTIDDIVVEYEATHSFKSVIYIKENMQTIWQVKTCQSSFFNRFNLIYSPITLSYS